MSTSDTATDGDNFQQLQQGNDQALDRIITRWRSPLHKFAYQYVRNPTDAQDLVAETFTRLYLQRHRMRADTNLSAWLFTALSNLCCNRHRWKKRHPTISLTSTETEGDGQMPDFSSSAEPAPNQVLESDEALRALHEAIENLPHDLKTTLLLHHFNTLSYKEIAHILNCSVRGVETRLYRAKGKLRLLLADYLNDGTRTPAPGPNQPGN
ncbi:MAG: RNA polymerase sigma factor [Cephaloticoccus sp.]|nr:RNA polymerase sigma factor [Cephaloticoccus sp.]MCF7761645.1 RNA polymerase sigma factor [Cephaloticoccus sp.]